MYVSTHRFSQVLMKNSWLNDITPPSQVSLQAVFFIDRQRSHSFGEKVTYWHPLHILQHITQGTCRYTCRLYTTWDKLNLNIHVFQGINFTLHLTNYNFVYFTKAAFTLNRFHWKTALQYSFSSKRCSVYTKSFFVVLSAEVNYTRGMWVCRFGKHSKFCMMRCRKCNFVLIDVEVGILLTFLESTKAKVHVCLYQKYISVFLCLHTKS